MTGIFDQQEFILRCYLAQFIQIRRMSCVIHRDDCLCVGRDLASHFLWVEIQRIWTNIREDRLRSLVEHAIRGGAESHGGSDCLIPRPQSGGKRRTVQCRGARTEADCVPRPDPLCKPFFKLGDLRSCGQPVRFQNLNHRLHIGVIQTLPPVWQQSFPHGFSPMDGECFQLCR